MSEPTTKQGARRVLPGSPVSDHRADLSPFAVRSEPSFDDKAKWFKAGRRSAFTAILVEIAESSPDLVVVCPCENPNCLEAVHRNGRVKDAPLPAPDAHQVNPPNLADAAEMLWVVLANVSGGDWTKQSPDWQEAVARWRDYYFAIRTNSSARPISAPASASRGTADRRSEDRDSLVPLVRAFAARIRASVLAGGAPGLEEELEAFVLDFAKAGALVAQEIMASPDASARRELEKLREVLVRANAGEEAESGSNYWARYGRSHAIALIDQRLSEWP